MKNMEKLLVIFAVLGAAVAQISCSRPDSREATVRRGLAAQPISLDPQLGADFSSSEVLRDLFEGLTTETATGEIAEGSSDRWLVSEDGRTYTFHIREGARWSNGDRVVAEDYVFGLRRAVDPNVASPASGLLFCIQNAESVASGNLPVSALGVNSIGLDTVEIRLRYSAPYLPALLAYPVAFPIHRASYNRFGPDFSRPGKLVSNGPYVLQSAGPGAGIELARNERYWNRRAVAIPNVQFVPTEDAKTELTRYRAGQLDVTSVVPVADFSWVKHALPNELQAGPQLGVYYLALNIASAGLVDNPQLRTALSLAIDREAITRFALKAGQTPALSFVPAGIPGYSPAKYDWANEDLQSRRARAKELFSKAGYGVKKPLHLRLLYAQAETVRYMTLAVAEQWHEVLGVEVEPEALEFRAFLARRADRASWDVLVNGWNADYPDPGNFLEVFRSNGSENDPGLHDPEYDRLLDQAMQEPDSTRRFALYGSAEKRLLADYGVLPIYFVASRRLVKPYVEGAVLNPMNHNYTKYWSINAKKRAATP